MQLREAAEALGVHYQTAYAWVRQGTLPARKTGRGYEVSDADVSALAERRASGTAPRPEVRVRDSAGPGRTAVRRDRGRRRDAGPARFRPAGARRAADAVDALGVLAQRGLHGRLAQHHLVHGAAPAFDRGRLPADRVGRARVDVDRQHAAGDRVAQARSAGLIASSARTWAVTGSVRSLVSWPAQPSASSDTPTWACASMKPGSTHLPVASTTATSAGTVKPGPSTAAILPSRSRTIPPSIGSPSTGTTRPPTIAVPVLVSVTRPR